MEEKPEYASNPEDKIYLAGTGTRYPRILERLNAMEEQEATGKIWNQTPLVNLLKNVAYIGDYLSNKECEIETEKGIKRCKNRGHADQYYIEEHHEPLISRELFDGVRALLERHLLFSNRTTYTEDDIKLLRYCRELAEKELKPYVG